MTMASESGHKGLSSSDLPLPSSATLIEKLPPDLMELIERLKKLQPELIEKVLLSLDVKSLSLLRHLGGCFSSLISDPAFAENHFRLTPKKKTRLFLSVPKFMGKFRIWDCPLPTVFNGDPDTPMELSYSSNKLLPFDLVEGSCNGILCIVNKKHVFLCNPSIQKFKQLLSYPHERHGCFMTQFGFGCDRARNYYKVVALSSHIRVRSYPPAYSTEYWVHTHKTDLGWRRIQATAGVHVPEGPAGCLYCVNGTLNWMISYYLVAGLSRSAIVSLDLENESFQQISPPEDAGAVVSHGSLAVLRDCLCFLACAEENCQCATGKGIRCCDLWLMKEYGNGESWTKLFRIPPYEGISDRYWSKVLYISEVDQVLLEVGFSSRLVVYDSRNGTFKPLKIEQRFRCANVYVESLISP